MTIVVGTIAYDYIMNFPGLFGEHILPEKIHQINLSFIVKTFAKRRGGTAGNVSYTLGLLETPHILFSAAGHDFSDYQKDFKKLNISTRDVFIDKNDYTSSGFAMTDKNNNQIWGFFYGASNHIKNLKLASVASRGDLVLIGPSSAQGSMSFVKQCIKEKINYIFDPGFILTQVSDSDLTQGVRNAYILIGNEYEIDLIKSRVKNFEKIISNKVVITTLGSEGAVVLDNNKKHKIRVSKAKKVTDPTGAGDAWRGGFLAGIERKFDIKTCAQMGSVASSFAVEEYGAQERRFTKNEFVKRYRQTYKSLIKL